MADRTSKTWGLMAEFPDVTSVYHAAQKVRDAGFTRWDVHSPFPIHAMDEAMGLKSPKVGFITGFGAICGVSLALGMQWWMPAVDYTVRIGGKPMFGWEQATPIAFELGILLASIFTLVGMLALNRLPMWYHPLLKKDRFLRTSDDRFIIAIEASDPKFDEGATRALLESLGGTNLDRVEA